MFHGAVNVERSELLLITIIIIIINRTLCSLLYNASSCIEQRFLEINAWVSRCIRDSSSAKFIYWLSDLNNIWQRLHYGSRNVVVANEGIVGESRQPWLRTEPSIDTSFLISVLPFFQKFLYVWHLLNIFYIYKRVIYSTLYNLKLVTLRIKIIETISWLFIISKIVCGVWCRNPFTQKPKPLTSNSKFRDIAFLCKFPLLLFIPNGDTRFK